MSELFPKTGAGMARGQSKQDYETPDDFMAAVGKRFGAPLWDLAAVAENRKAMNFLSPEDDSLTLRWCNLYGLKWLNPPFANIAPWAKKCHELTRDWHQCGHRILLLTPASVGANWYRDFVHDRARVLFLNGRLKFKGAEDYYPKDCMLSCFGFEPGFEVWNWRAL